MQSAAAPPDFTTQDTKGTKGALRAPASHSRRWRLVARLRRAFVSFVVLFSCSPGACVGALPVLSMYHGSNRANPDRRAPRAADVEGAECAGPIPPHVAGRPH